MAAHRPAALHGRCASACSERRVAFPRVRISRPHTTDMRTMKKPAAACRRSQAAPPADVDDAMLPLVEQARRPDWYTEPDNKVQLMVYLVTAAKLVNEEDCEADPPLRDPANITKQEFHEAVMDSLANPICVGAGRKRSKPVELDTYLGVIEGLAAAGHHHAGLRFHKQKHSFNPFKLALRRRHRIATHWSTSHTEFFSIARYLQRTASLRQTGLFH